ncbi:unnamed protein product [Thelazia callipaeda]|uniref:Calpain_III domain-containing protein n=1 Tax=Thelazia callipaeda TaxID=103827 RepID=A0A0N5D7F1_THECL|nr:unnamed protein product [Thelazia callipaeda]
MMLSANSEGCCHYNVDRLIIPSENIAKHLYWKPDHLAPAHSELSHLTLFPGQHKFITIKLRPFNGTTFFALNRYAERDYTMAIYHSNSFEEENTCNLDEMDEWIPVFMYPAMPTVDYLQKESLGPGTYKLRFGNEQAWIRPVTVYYRIRLLNGNGEEVPYEIIT